MFQYKVTIEGNNREIFRFPFELAGSNMYFIPSRDTGIVIDPNENEEIISVFEQYGTRKVTIILTHEHYDHTIGVEWLQSRIENVLFCHQDCAKVISTEQGNNPMTLAILLTVRDAIDGGHRRDEFLSIAKRYVLKVDETFEGEFLLRVGDINLKCLSAPGHSKGSALYVWDDACVFTGDSLIQRTPTIIKLPGSDKSAYNNITRPILRSLKKDIMVFPGHEDPFCLADAMFL